VRFINLDSLADTPAALSLKITEADLFTEWFEANDNDLAGRTLELLPDGSRAGYRVCRRAAETLPVDPTGGTALYLQDDDFAALEIFPSTISFFGTDYDTIYVGSNGYISFFSGDFQYIENLENHFALPRIALLFDDLDPSLAGTISWKQLDYSIAITYEKVPEHRQIETTNTFQAELFYNGKLRLTWLTIQATDGLAGLSAGQGMSSGFVESDLSDYEVCRRPGDLNGDGKVTLEDFARLSDYWLGECGPANTWCGGADLVGSSRVGTEDLLEFSLSWLMQEGPKH